MASNYITNWLRFLLPTAKPPRKPAEMGDPLRDYTYSTVTNVSGALSPDDLQGILQQAADGYCDQQALLIKEIQEKEPVIAAHLATRKNAITGKPWTVTSEENPDRAEEIDKMLRDAGLTVALAHLSDFLATGYAGVITDWADGGKAVRGFVPVAPEAFEFDYAGNPALKDKSGNTKPLADYHAAQFLTIYSQAKPGLPCRNGLGRALVWLYLFKHSGLAGFARYIERYGVPFLLSTLPQAQWADRNAVLSLLKAMGRDGVAVQKEGAKLELLQGANGSSTDAQERFLRYCDEVFAITILGQLATSGDAGGMSKGQAQENVRMDLLAADCMALMDTVQRGLVTPLCQMAYGMPDAGDIVFDIEYQPADDLDALAARWKILTEITGRPLDTEFVAEQFGVTFAEEPEAPEPPETTPAAAPVEEEDAPEGEGSKTVGGGPGDPADQGTPDDLGAESDQQAMFDTSPAGTLNLVVEDALARVTSDPEAMAAWLGPVQDAIRENFSDLSPTDVDEFKRRLPAFMLSLPRLLGKMDSAAFEGALSSAMLAAVVNGYTGQK